MRDIGMTTSDACPMGFEEDNCAPSGPARPPHEVMKANIINVIVVISICVNARPIADFWRVSWAIIR